MTKINSWQWYIEYEGLAECALHPENKIFLV